jgi:hypothetical protein
MSTTHEHRARYQDPITEPIPRVDKKEGRFGNKKFIAGLAIGGTLFAGAAGAVAGFGGDKEAPGSSPRPVATGEAVPGQKVDNITPSPEFVAAQKAVDKALPYLDDDNEGNRNAFVAELDNVSTLKGANYFNNRGYNFTATADTSAADALDWLHLQVYKADKAAAEGDLVKADAITNVIAEGQEYTEINAELANPTPNISATYVTKEAPILEVIDNGSIRYSSTDVVTIDQPGTKLYAFTAKDTDSSVLQYVIKFTPATNSKEGAWSYVASLDPGTVTSADITQY